MQNMQAPQNHKYLKATFVAFFHHGHWCPAIQRLPLLPRL